MSTFILSNFQKGDEDIWTEMPVIIDLETHFVELGVYQEFEDRLVIYFQRL